MTWLAIIIVIIFLSVLSNKKKQREKISAEGGILIKYATLIEALQQADVNPTVFKSQIDYISFGWATPNAINTFQLMESNQLIVINWEFKGRIAMLNKTIKLSKVWRFPESGNQEAMANKVLTEMTEKFNNSEFGAF